MSERCQIDEVTSRKKLKGVVVLTRREDGTWQCCPDDWMWEPLSEKKAQKSITFNRIMGGIQSRTFPAKEHKPCAGCKHLDEEGGFPDDQPVQTEVVSG